MPYTLEEEFEDGTTVVPGEPIFDLVIAKVIAARRASRLRRVTMVRDQETGAELNRFNGNTHVPAKSGHHMKAADLTHEQSRHRSLFRAK